jgi:hypothetical protein
MATARFWLLGDCADMQNFLSSVDEHAAEEKEMAAVGVTSTSQTLHASLSITKISPTLIH